MKQTIDNVLIDKTVGSIKTAQIDHQPNGDSQRHAQQYFGCQAHFLFYFHVLCFFQSFEYTMRNNDYDVNSRFRHSQLCNHREQPFCRNYHPLVSFNVSRH